MLACIGLYGLSTAAFGSTGSFELALLFLALGGAADGASTVVRQTLRQLLTPDHLRGRMTGVTMIFFMGGPQLGELEAGAVARLFGVRTSVDPGRLPVHLLGGRAGGRAARAAALSSARAASDEGALAMSRLRVSIELPVHGVTFAQVRELARAAEAAGLDGVWVPDHLVPLRAGRTVAARVLDAARCGRRRDHARCASARWSWSLPLRDPVLLGLEARTLAGIAAGRFVLGIGLGGFTYRRAARSLGLAVHELPLRGEALATAVARLRATLGAGVSRAAVPLWLGGRSRAVLALAARAADGWNCPFVAEFAARGRELDSACARRRPRPAHARALGVRARRGRGDRARRRVASPARPVPWRSSSATSSTSTSSAPPSVPRRACASSRRRVQTRSRCTSRAITRAVSTRSRSSGATSCALLGD